MFTDIKEAFDNLIRKLEFDASQYLNLGEDNSKNIFPVASIYEQIQLIYECAEIIDIKKTLR